MTLLHNHKTEGGQSSVFKIGNICRKLYPLGVGIDRKDLFNYLNIQKLLNTDTFEFDFEPQIQLKKDVLVKKAIVSFNDTPLDISTCTLDEENYLVVEQYFVDGKNLREFVNDNEQRKYQRDLMVLLETISSTIGKKLEVDMSEDFFVRQIHEINVKVLDYDKISATLQLKVTDIACTINEFIKKNQANIKRLLGD